MADDVFTNHLANNYVNDKGGIQLASTSANQNTTGQPTQPQAPTRDLGFVKWQANPYPAWMKKFHGLAGAGLGGAGGGILGSMLTGGSAGTLAVPGWGTAAGAVAGAVGGAYVEEALDYIGVPSNVEITLPNIPEPPQIDPTDTSRPGSGLEFRPPVHPSPSSR